jgi:hypothetical protein
MAKHDGFSGGRIQKNENGPMMNGRLTMATSPPGVLFLKSILACGALLLIQQLALLSRFHLSAMNGGPRSAERTTRVLSSDETVSSRPPTLTTTEKDDFDGVIPRAFDPWPANMSLPCFEPEPDWRYQQETPTNDGLVFIKPYKTGSSTASGINLRMARNIARRRQASDGDTTNFQLCKSRFDHSTAADLIPDRRPGKSYLWSIIRDPTQRLVSHFFHMRVSRHKREPSIEAFRDMIYDYLGGSLAHDYYLSTLSISGYHPGGDLDPVETANTILKDYDFIGVTERMDESAVAMAMLLGLPFGDVLYLKAKGHGGYDDGGGRGDMHICTYIWPGFLTNGMREILKGEDWLERSRFDRALHQAANRSLDLTIDKLGRSDFERNLALYRKAQEVAHERCFSQTIFPCSKEGNYTREGQTDCLWNDSGCGYECLDQVATELDLWKPYEPLIITEAEGFRFAPRTWCGLYEADSCSACLEEEEDREPVCGGDCQWCKYGADMDEHGVEESKTNPFDAPTGQCVPAASNCRHSYSWPESPAASKSPPHLLDARFYVYEELLWLGKAKVAKKYHVDDWVQNEQEIKHTDDWWFAKAALNHPKRTMNPAEAKIFVVPTLINVIVDQLVEFDTALCFQGKCNLELLQSVNEFLENSTWFQRNQGSDHIVVASHYAAEWFVPHYDNIMKCHMIGMENRKWNDPSRTMMPSLYVGKSCRLRERKDDFAMIASMPRYKPAFQSRKDVCEWMQRYRKGFSMTNCGQGKQCPGLGESRFGFHVRGDTYGSNRLMDTLLSGTVPVFTFKEQYDVLPDWIDWEKISTFASVFNQTEFLANVDAIGADDHGYKIKSKLVLESRDLFNWETTIPFDTYLYMLSVHLWPHEEIARRQHENVTSPYPALILPKLIVGPKVTISETGANEKTTAVSNHGQQRKQQPVLTNFRVFDPESKIGVWCGSMNGPAPTCGDCPSPNPQGKTGEEACRGGCMWCEYGAVEDERNDDNDNDDADDDQDDSTEHKKERDSKLQLILDHRIQCVAHSRVCRQGPKRKRHSFSEAAQTTTDTE